MQSVQDSTGGSIVTKDLDSFAISSFSALSHSLHPLGHLLIRKCLLQSSHHVQIPGSRKKESVGKGHASMLVSSFKIAFLEASPNYVSLEKAYLPGRLETSFKPGHIHATQIQEFCYQGRKEEWVLDRQQSLSHTALLILHVVCVCVRVYLLIDDRPTDRCLRRNFRASHGGIIIYMQYFWGHCTCSFKNHIHKFQVLDFYIPLKVQSADYPIQSVSV